MFEFLNSGLSALFGPIIALPPVLGELIMAGILTFLITLIYKFAINQKEMKELREEQNKINKEVKELQKKNPEEANKRAAEMLQLTNKMMKMNMKAMLPTMFLVIMVLPWLSTVYTGPVALLPFTLPYFGSDFGWLMWYILASFSLTPLFRKLMGVQ